MIVIANVNEDKMEPHTPSFTIGVRNLGRFVLSLPAFGFIACVLLSLIYNFEGSTATHCGVTVPFRSLSCFWLLKCLRLKSRWSGSKRWIWILTVARTSKIPSYCIGSNRDSVAACNGSWFAKTWISTPLVNFVWTILIYFHGLNVFNAAAHCIRVVPRFGHIYSFLYAVYFVLAPYPAAYSV